MFFLLTLLFQTTSCRVGEGSGTFVIDGIFPVSASYDNITWINWQSGFLMAEAMRFALQETNAWETLYGYQLAIGEMKDVQNTYEVRRALKDTYTAERHFVIGPYSSQTSYIASILTETFQLPAISYAARYSEFEVDKWMSRTVPSDAFQIEALLNVIKTSGWNYLSIVSSYKQDGEIDSAIFALRLRELGICVAGNINLPAASQGDEREMDRVLAKLDSHKSTRNHDRPYGVVLFTNNRDTRNFYAAIHRRNQIRQFSIVCVSGCTSYLENVENHEIAAAGTISIDIQAIRLTGFAEFLSNQKPNSNSYEYFNRTWENMFKCSLAPKHKHETKCSLRESIDRNLYKDYIPVYTVAEAVYGINYATNQYIRLNCRRKHKCNVDATNFMHSNKIHNIMIHEKLNMTHMDGTLEEVLPALDSSYVKEFYAVKYDIRRFTRIGMNEFEPVKIGEWKLMRPKKNHTSPRQLVEEGRSSFSMNSTGIPVSICSDECLPGFIALENKLKGCCWKCFNCGENEVSKSNKCVACKDTEKVVGNQCTSIPEKTDTVSLVLVAFVVIGLLATLIVLGFFLKKRQSEVIEVSGDLPLVILLGLLLIFLSPVIFMVEPSAKMCAFRLAIPGLALILTYAPLLLRTIILHRMHLKSRTSDTQRSGSAFIAREPQMCIVSVAVVLQILVSVVWFTSNPPQVTFTNVNKEYVLEQCGHVFVGLLVNTALSLFFIATCTILAFKTRQLTYNSVEAQHIAVTMYATCPIFAIFIPLICFIDDGPKDTLMCALYIVVGFIALLGVFAQKIRMLLFRRRSGDTTTLTIQNNAAESLM